MFDRILDGRSFTEKANIHWERVAQAWLREPLKKLTREHLVASTREWSTIVTWVRGFGRLSDFLSRRNITGPEQIDRNLFLLFLEEQRVIHNDSAHNRQVVNTVSAVLTDLKVDGFLPELGSEMFLRSGENAASRIRSPRPWPRDVLGRIESRLLENPDVDHQVRLMLRFCRWAGPRSNELVTLPIDALLENGKGGYWMEYWMPKVKRHRRFPLPTVLGEELATERRRVIEVYGPEAKHMFPQPLRSNAITRVTRPWSRSGFATHVAGLFVKHDILASNITGELVSGTDIHRFRHTIGTELLNNGWTQQEVMEFLGHASPTMTAAYARILDETLNKKADEYHRRLAEERNSNGANYADPRVERMRERITAVTPVGYCTLPSNQSCEVRDNPCLTCVFHSRGDGAFDEARGVYRTKLKTTIVQAKNDGNNAVAALNEKILGDLDQMEDSY